MIGVGNEPLGAGQLVRARLDQVVRDPVRVSPRVALGGERLNAARVAEFKEILGEDLQALPAPVCVEYDRSLILADGHHRVAALQLLANEHPGDPRFEFITVRIASKPTEAGAINHAYEIALDCSAKGPLLLTRSEKQEAIKRLLAEHPDWSDREIARRVGVAHKTVGNVRRRGISPEPDTTSAQSTEGAETSPARVSKIASQIVRYGNELGSADAVDYRTLLDKLAEQFLKLHPATAPAWAEWWQELFSDLRRQLETTP